LRKTKIVCTIGPACDGEEILRRMIIAGMNVARFNFSHASHEYHREKMNRVKKLRDELGIPVAILLDTRGPEIRTGKLENGEAELIEGETIVLTTEEILGNEKRVSVTYENLPANLSKGDAVMVDDGQIELMVKDIQGTEIICEIIAGEILKNSKGINIPDVAIDMPFMNEKDKNDILFGIENDVDFIALSFVRDQQDVKDVRRLLNSHGNYNIEIISKIENTEGVKNIEEIINVSDGIMVARGDLAIEVPLEELPYLQKKIITSCYSAGKKVITATHMLESMIKHPRPTRAEITDIANAIYDGTSALMLSGETSAGAYPLKSLQTMIKIAEKTESYIDYKTYSEKIDPLKRLEVTISNAISDATCRAAHDLDAAAIVAVTMTGSSARRISRFRPASPIIAVTPLIKSYMQLALSWGIIPVMHEYVENPHELFNEIPRKIMEKGLIKEGDVIVMTGSTQRSAGATNTLQVHIAGDILVKGTGSGAEDVSGRVCVIRSEKDLSTFVSGDILAVSRTNNDILLLMRRCGGIITEENEKDSGVAAAAYALDIPVISDAKGATSILKTGSKIRIDVAKGYVYNSGRSDADLFLSNPGRHAAVTGGE
jgi:pyruvate kinase